MENRNECKNGCPETKNEYDYGLEGLNGHDKNLIWFEYDICFDYYDEYIVFVKTNKYTTTRNRVIELPNATSLFDLYGDYDFVFKYYSNKEKSYAEVLRLLNSTMFKDFEERGTKIRLLKITALYYKDNDNNIRLFEKRSDKFRYHDIRLKEYFVHENFILIEKRENTRSDLISNLNNTIRKDEKIYIYCVFKVKDEHENRDCWVVCTRYKCFDYWTKQESLQKALNSFVDNPDNKGEKTTFTSESNVPLDGHIGELFSNIKIEDIISCASNEKKVDMIKKLIEELCKIKIYFSYKRKERNSNKGGDSQGNCVLFFDWMTKNGFTNIHRDEKEENNNTRKFMDDLLKKAQFLIVCADYDYFRSRYCMYELTGFVKKYKKNSFKRILFISPYKYMDSKNMESIKKYWENCNDNDRYTLTVKKNISESLSETTILQIIADISNFEEIKYSINAKKRLLELLEDLMHSRQLNRKKIKKK